MDKSKWVWMGHAAHFILGRKCRFRLATVVGKYIVSTVGEWVPDNSMLDITKPEFRLLQGDNKEYAYIKKYGCENIGHGRKYETMVFKAKKSRHKCCPYEITGSELDGSSYNKPEDAYKGHLEMCERFSKIK